MARSRRALLAALAGLAGASGCLRGSTGEPRRPPRVPATTTEEPWTFTPAEPEPDKPNVVGQQLLNGSGGNLKIAASMRNDATVPVDGTLNAYVTVNGTERRYQTDFSLPANETRLVNASVPVDYETFIESPELRLSVSLPEETTTSTAST